METDNGFLFGSIKNVLHAQADDLSALQGIGPATARRIRSVVSEPRSAYGVAQSCFQLFDRSGGGAV